ncbi:MAG TPA: ABC transporter substrate-binding protein [Pusillimonas sp.]|uniref:ABC transporter substrate-binding protein n=1 Tax=unclassified Pusillimonas TaxID=2640016 RepID=UPI00260288C0|nr:MULTISPECIES: ABC transporter substrate-binding protein [unclassified Pusillimonas]HLU20450.1 ABC transporter substrate-binding protein [Pusillimonas sp.]
MKKLLIAAMLGACVSMASAPALAADKLEEITYLLPAPKNLPAFAPWILAQHQGYFKEEGLSVNFISGKGGVDVAKQVGAGNAPIGGAMGDTSIIVRANGVPVKSVAVLGAGGLVLIASHEDAPVDEPAQLKGKTITVISYADTAYFSLLGTMQKAGLTRNDADIQAAGPAGVWQLFASKKADVMAGVPDWVASVRHNGGKVHLMDPAKGFNSMAQAMIASDETIKNNPELIQRIVRATLKGMEFIMKDPDGALAAYIEAVPAHKGREDEMREVFSMYNKYVYADQKVPGHIDAERLAAVQDFYVSQGIVGKATPLEDLYTNQFIEGLK